MTEKVDTQQDRFCAYGRDPVVSGTRDCCYRIKYHGHGGDGIFCRKHSHLAGTKEEIWHRARCGALRDALSVLRGYDNSGYPHEDLLVERIQRDVTAILDKEPTP